MQPNEFNKLKYGNVIANPAGEKFLVLHVNRDKEGTADFVGIIPAITASDAINWPIISKASSETFLAERQTPDGPETYLRGRSVPAVPGE